MLFISIPAPCHENWNEMSPAGQGAYCNVCSKTVIDFTGLSDAEVQNYFLSNRGKKTCGRFRNDQLTDVDDPLPGILAAAIPFWKKFLAIVFIAFGSFLTSCQNDKMGKIQLGTPIIPAEAFDTATAAIIPQIPVDEPAGVKDKGGGEACTSTMGITFTVVGDTVAMPVETVQGEAGILIIPEENIEPANKKMLDKNGNEIREQE